MTIFEAANPAVTQEMELPAPPVADGWDLSPDGTRVAMLATSPAKRLMIIDLRTREVVREYDAVPAAQWAAWLPDAGGWLVAAPVGNTGTEMIHLDTQGNAKILWKSTYHRLWRPIVSPDGRHVAFSSGMMESGAWMMRGF